MSSPRGVSLSAPIRRSSDRWLHLWAVPKLESRSHIEWSSRLTRSLGRAFPDKRLVRIASFLSTADEPLLEEILCHEMAHLATRELYGRKARPHGPEWKALMVKAGFEPRTRLPSPNSWRLLVAGAAVASSTSTAARFARSFELRGVSFVGGAALLAWHPDSKGVSSLVGGSGGSEVSCPFCEPDPELVFYRGALVLGLWDAFPVSEGHALLVTKRHVPAWFDATREEQAELLSALAIAREGV